MTLSKSWAFSGQAIDAVGDPHLAAGMHFRVLTNPLLGLPVLPLVVGRAKLGQLAKKFTRSDVTWFDSRGERLTTPFIVTPDNPVTGHLPPGEVCCWAVIETLPSFRRPIPDPLRPPIFRHPPIHIPGLLNRIKPGPRERVRFGQRDRVRVDARDRVRVDAGDWVVPFDRDRIRLLERIVRERNKQPFAGQIPHQPDHLRVEGVVTTPYGDAPVAVRSKAPYHIYASHLERIVVRGSGIVAAMSWLPAAAVEHSEPFRISGLPADPGPRYHGPPDGQQRGLDRVKRGAPQRFGMHESARANDPTGCAPVGSGEEIDRVRDLSEKASGALRELITNTSAPQSQLTFTEEVLSENGSPLGSTDRFLLREVLMGAVDPGFARWLGFLDVDNEDFDSQDVVAYVVDVVFAPDWKGLRDANLEPFLREAVIADGDEVLNRLLKEHPEFQKDLEGATELGKGPFLVQRVVLAATVDVPLDRPARPDLTNLTSGDWLPSTPPAAARELSTELEHLVPGAGLASAIAQPEGARPVERNAAHMAGRRLLLTPQPNPEAPQPNPEGQTATSGMLTDRAVDEQDGRWRIAQLDWFGRWSQWGSSKFGAETRPGPPRPVFTLTTRQPDVPTPAPTGRLSGWVRIEVSVPPVSGLPPGGRLLRHLTLTVTTSGAGTATTTHPLPNPNAPEEALILNVPGPALFPTASGTVTVEATWTDAGGLESESSEPKTVTLFDPRPPAPVPSDPNLVYTSRPDATGRARAQLRWSHIPGQASYRVFFADETTLLAKLAEVANGRVTPNDQKEAPSQGDAQSLLRELGKQNEINGTAGDGGASADGAGVDDTAVDAPTRGEIWEAHRQLLPRRWWRQLAGEPLPAPPSASDPVTFTHDLSGSLTVLALYRVVAVSESSVESDLPSSPLFRRSVPNLLVPPVPSLEVLPVLDEHDNLQAELTVTVPLGPTPAARFRLRRATGTTQTELMQIVAEGDARPRPDGDPVPQEFPVFDSGSSPSGERDSLTAWVRYHWRVEVQGGPAPGHGPLGEWSSPSDPVATDTMPPEAPVGVSDLSVRPDGPGVLVQFLHPNPLAGGASTGYTIDVYRQLPGEVLRLFRSFPAHTPADPDDPADPDIPTPTVGRRRDGAGIADVTDTFDVPDSDSVPGTLYRVVVTDPIGRSSPPSDPKEAQ